MNPDKTSLLMRVLDRLFEKKVIVNCARDPYLHRWYVFRTERMGLFIHKFVRSDEDRALHDHPWSFFVIPLWGGYIEHSDRELDHFEKWVAIKSWTEINQIVPSGLTIEQLKEAVNARVGIERRIWPLVSSRYRNTKYRHRVELIGGRPSWSIFFRFSKLREWGFWPKTGFIQWNRWWQENKCE